MRGYEQSIDDLFRETPMLARDLLATMSNQILALEQEKIDRKKELAKTKIKVLTEGTSGGIRLLSTPARSTAR